MENMRKQAERFRAELIYDAVTRVDFSKRPFEVFVGEEPYISKTVIISSGASAKLLGLESERKLMGRGVSTCATCDGAFFRNQEVMVVGGGDTAMEDANFITKFASKVSCIAVTSCAPPRSCRSAPSRIPKSVSFGIAR